MLDVLAAAGRLDRDRDGPVTGAAGLSLTTGQHHLGIDGMAFRTWCAYDSLGIVAALAVDADIETDRAICGTAAGGPARATLAGGRRTSLRDASAIRPVLLCSAEHAAEWSQRQGGRGRAVNLVEAAHLGAEGWPRAPRA